MLSFIIVILLLPKEVRIRRELQNGLYTTYVVVISIVPGGMQPDREVSSSAS